MVMVNTVFPRIDNERMVCVNVRPSIYEEFWGNEYKDSLYLWEGAKHNLTLTEMSDIKVPTVADLFDTEEDIDRADEYCRQVHSSILPLVSDRLNEIHGLRLPVTFWQTVFGYWLFRHVCVAYEKYAVLNQLKVDDTSIKLLDEYSFYIPDDHYDYVECFGSDHGVMQLVSQYYQRFSTKPFQRLRRGYELAIGRTDLNPMCNLIVTLGLDSKDRVMGNEQHDPKRRNYVSILRNLLRRRKDYCTIGEELRAQRSALLVQRGSTEARMVVCGLYGTSVAQLIALSRGQIQTMSLPDIVMPRVPVDMEKRQKLCDFHADSEFEQFLRDTLVYCFPKILVEYFKDYYEVFSADVLRRRFTHFVTEVWMSFFPVSIYAAVAKHHERKLLIYQHGASMQWHKNNLCWLEHAIADKYLTTGWKSPEVNIVSAGFREVPKYFFSPKKKDITYVASTRLPYRIQFGEAEGNRGQIRSLQRVQEFIDCLPDRLREHFVLRPRRVKSFWDTEHTWEIANNRIRTDDGPFAMRVDQSRVVVIDHFSTAIAEVLLMGVPIIILYDDTICYLTEDCKKSVSKLIACGVVHTSPQSAVALLSDVYDNIEQWWNSRAIQQAVGQIISANLGSPSATPDYLLKCLSEK